MVMATAFERTLGAFISTIEYCYFRYLNNNHYNNNNRNSNNNNIPFFAGIDWVEVDLEVEKVTVIGYVDGNKVLKAVRRSGKRAELWPNPNPPLQFTSPNEYFKDMSNDYKESYNYYRHGYNVGDKYGIIPVSHRGDDKVSNIFNDDNVNACSLM